MLTGRAARIKHKVQLKPFLRAQLLQACAKEGGWICCRAWRRLQASGRTFRVRGTCMALCRGNSLHLDTQHLSELEPGGTVGFRKGKPTRNLSLPFCEHKFSAIYHVSAAPVEVSGATGSPLQARRSLCLGSLPLAPGAPGAASEGVTAFQAHIAGPWQAQHPGTYQSHPSKHCLTCASLFKTVSISGGVHYL